MGTVFDSVFFSDERIERAKGLFKLNEHLRALVNMTSENGEDYSESQRLTVLLHSATDDCDREPLLRTCSNWDKPKLVHKEFQTASEAEEYIYSVHSKCSTPIAVRVVDGSDAYYAYGYVSWRGQKPSGSGWVVGANCLC